jgi:hypothetical protein
VKYLFRFAVIRNGDFTCCVVFRALKLSSCLQNNTCFFCPGEVPLRYITVPVKDKNGNIEMKSLVFEYCHLVVCVLRLLGLASAICLRLRAFQKNVALCYPIILMILLFLFLSVHRRSMPLYYPHDIWHWLVCTRRFRPDMAKVQEFWEHHRSTGEKNTVNWMASNNHIPIGIYGDGVVFNKNNEELLGVTFNCPLLTSADGLSWQRRCFVYETYFMFFLQH